MRTFNKIVAVILILVALPLGTLLLVFPDLTAEALAVAFSGLAERFATFSEMLRLGMGVLALVVDLALFLLLYLELRRKAAPGGRVMRVRGGEGEVSLDAIHQRVHHHVSQLTDVVEVRPEVNARGGRVAVALDVVTSPYVNVPQKLDEIVQVVREAITGGMGLKLRGKPRVSLRHVSYDNASPPAPSASPKVSEPATESGETVRSEEGRTKSLLDKLPGRSGN